MADRLVFLSLIFAIANFATVALADYIPTQDTCRGSYCPNACARNDLVCCFCDSTKNYLTQTCACCPKDHSCCKNNDPTKYQGSTCCAPGTTCQYDGTCTYSRQPPAISTTDYYAGQCRSVAETQLRVTADDKLVSVYFDGTPKSVNNPNDWTKTKFYILPNSVSVIAIYGTNVDRAGGIMVSSTNGLILSNHNWKCTSSVNGAETWWMNKDYDDSDWDDAYLSDQNIPGQPRNQYLKDFSHDAYWIWSNWCPKLQTGSGWNENCYCRLKIY